MDTHTQSATLCCRVVSVHARVIIYTHQVVLEPIRYVVLGSMYYWYGRVALLPESAILVYSVLLVVVLPTRSRKIEHCFGFVFLNKVRIYMYNIYIYT